MSEYPPIPPDPVIEAYKKDVDVTLIRENLKLTPDQRLQKLMAMQRAVEELRRAVRESRARAGEKGIDGGGHPGAD